jgi:abortive infection bacteriophage resistance protein
MIEYNKPPLSVEDQIKLLEKRGLSFTNKEQAKTNLSNISYYRISPYTTPLKKSKMMKSKEISKITLLGK